MIDRSRRQFILQNAKLALALGVSNITENVTSATPLEFLSVRNEWNLKFNVTPQQYLDKIPKVFLNDAKSFKSLTSIEFKNGYYIEANGLMLSYSEAAVIANLVGTS